MGQGEGSGEGQGRGQGHGGKGQGDKGMVAGMCCLIIIVVIIVLGLFGMNIAKIVMGAVHMNNCPYEKMIPIYLVVAGSTAMMLGGLTNLKSKGDDDTRDLKDKCNIFTIIGVIGFVFTFAWLICEWMPLHSSFGIFCISGAVHMNNCPYEKMIPIYLVVAGSTAMMLGGFTNLKSKGDDDTRDLKDKCNIFTIIGVIGLVFTFAWLICGSVWVFGNYSDIIDGCGGSNDCCNESLIKFALAAVILDWIFIGILIVIILLAICIACGVPFFYSV